MLTLTMALVAAPRLLMIDELSLGLAPEVTKGLQQRLRDLRDAGTAIVVVEQSVDRAVELADRAYFLDQGEVRFAGPTAELLDHPDLVRAIFLGAAAASAAPPAPTDGGSGTDRRRPRLELTGIRRLRRRGRARRRLADPSTRARSSGSWARTVRARPRCSTSSPGSFRPTPASIVLRHDGAGGRR